MKPIFFDALWATLGVLAAFGLVGSVFVIGLVAEALLKAVIVVMVRRASRE